MGNLDFTLDPTFSWFVVASLVSGLILLVLSATGLGGQTGGQRAVNGLVGLAFLGYGIYLNWIFNGTEYYILWYAFIVPVLLIVQIFKARSAAKAPQAPPPAA